MFNLLSKLAAVTVLAAGAPTFLGACTVTTVIPFNSPTAGITVDPLRNVVYVVAPQADGIHVNLARINGTTNQVEKTIALPSGAYFPAVDYHTNRIYVAGCNYQVSPAACAVTVIDGRSDTITASIPVTTTPGEGLTGIVASPSNGLVYVANGSDNVINILHESDNKLIGSIDLKGNTPSAIALNPSLNLLYVTYGSNQTATVDATSKKIIATTNFGSNTTGVAVNYYSGNVFVANQETSTQSSVGILNFYGKVLAKPVVGDGPLGVDVDPITNYAFVISTLQNQVDVIDGYANRVVDTLSGIPGLYVAVNVTHQTVYISGTNGVTVLAE